MTKRKNRKLPVIFLENTCILMAKFIVGTGRRSLDIAEVSRIFSLPPLYRVRSRWFFAKTMEYSFQNRGNKVFESKSWTQLITRRQRGLGETEGCIFSFLSSQHRRGTHRASLPDTEARPHGARLGEHCAPLARSPSGLGFCRLVLT